jgi:hypothetical protein
MMKNLFRKYWYLTVVAVLFFASASFAQTTVDVTNVGDGVAVYNSSGTGYYVDPYGGTVGGVASTLICDDWADNSNLNTPFQANISSITPTGITGSTPLFGNNPGLYNEAAWLASQLLGNTNATSQAELSFALWELTFPHYPYSPGEADPESPFAFLGTNNNTILAGAQAYLCEAAGSSVSGCTGAGEASYNASGWEILTPTMGSNQEQQEFLVRTPESSAVVLFAADMLGLLGLAIVFRRRLLRPIL